MNMRFRFKGGPFGGEEQVLDPSMLVGGLLQVPSYTPASIGSYDQTAAPFPLYTVEEYRISGSLADGGGYGYTMQWVHPSERLIHENEQLKKELAELESFKGLMESLKDFYRVLA